MGKIIARPETGKLLFDFRYQGVRCREQTSLPDKPANRKRLEKLLERMEAEMTLGTFDYAEYFPGSPRAATLGLKALKEQRGGTDSPLFSEFAETWFGEMQIQWRRSHASTIRGTLDSYLLPAFNGKEVARITRADVLAFRSTLAKVTTRKNKPLSASRINKIMMPLRMILNEAADRFQFTSPYTGIKPLKVPKSEVEPFSIDEVQKIISHIRPDYRNYVTVRFFTGMRTSEVDGLQWDCVDFERGQILVRHALVWGEMQSTKTDGSNRAIDMSRMVYDALLAQREVTGHGQFVFCNSAGKPVDHNNFTKRVWYPLLRYLGLRQRRPYHTRHTAATLWLAAGETPEWIARQMGHSTTEMLFRVYSRYVPNLTRQDGSAFERLLQQNFQITATKQDRTANPGEGDKA